MAAESMIDVTTIAGSGPEGRIVREDIEKAIAARSAGAEAPAPASPAGPADGEIISGKRVRDTIPLKSMRKAIAEHMHRSLAVSAQLFLAAFVITVAIG